MRSQVTIQQTKLGDHMTAYVCEKWEANASGGREFIQDLGRVVADPDHPDPAPLDLPVYLLQLNELRLAVGSPGGASVEDDQRAPAIAPAVQSHRPPFGIRKLEVGKRVAERRTNLLVISLCHVKTNRHRSVSVPRELRLRPQGVS
ncbi:MAG: hypothetical protein NVS9B11_09680 [Candidatus Dormibacteraceae bacterium]